MEAQFLQIFERILRPHESARRAVEPIVEPRQEETQRTAPRQERQRFELRRGDRPHRAIARQHEPRLGDIEAAIAFETPGVETDGNVVSESIGAGEIEVDDPRYRLAAKEDVVREKISMDDAAWQRVGPAAFERLKLGGELVGEAGAHLVGAVAARLEAMAPA